MARSNNTASARGTVVKPKSEKIGKPSMFDHALVAVTSDTAKELGKSAAHGAAFGLGAAVAYVVVEALAG